MTEQQKYMKAALRLAQKAAEEGEVPVGAVVVCEGKSSAAAGTAGRPKKRAPSCGDRGHRKGVQKAGRLAAA